MKRYREMFSVCVFVVFLAGCAGKDLVVEKIPVTAHPSEEIAQLGNDLNVAKQNSVDLLSPQWFSKAQESLARATKLRESGEKVEDILGAVAVGRAELKEARAFAQISRTSLSEVLRAREDARKAGAMQIGDKYSDVENDFLRLSKAIENNNLQRAESNKGDIVERYRSLELWGIKNNVLGESRTVIAEAVKEGAEDFAPLTLKEAKSGLATVDDFITKNRYASDSMREQARTALFQANRLLQITREAKGFSTKNPEQVALSVEGMLSGIRKAGSLADSRDQGFTAQAGMIQNAVAALGERGSSLAVKTEELATEVASLKGKAETEGSTVAKLRSEKEFQQKFDKVHSLFSPKEASVLKDGNNLIVRLKALNYPVGKSVLFPDNYALLTKVGEAVRIFGEPKLVIEGHTDASGPAKLNDLLSAERAKTVKEYFVANNVLPADKIVTKGMGYKAPIATNKTSEGRALNRRIDVILEPERVTAE